MSKALAPAIKWAAKAKPEIPESQDERSQASREYAEKYDGKKSGSSYVVVCKDFVEIATPTREGGITLSYTDKKFKERFDAALRKSQFKVLEEC